MSNKNLSPEHEHNDAHPPSHNAALTDPVCGMQVSKDSPYHVEYKRRHFHFCSAKCMGTFNKAPEQFLTPASGRDDKDLEQSVAPGTIYTCPMHPEIRQNRPGSCPKCGMALEPLLPSLDDDNPELRDFSRRFWWTLPFTIIVSRP